MANQSDNQVAGGDDELDFRPLPAQRTPSPRGAAPAAAQARVDDGIDFQPVGAAPRGQRAPSPGQPPRVPSNAGGLDFQPHAQSPAAQQPETISAYRPTLLRRIENVFTEGVPRYSSRTVNNPKYGQMQISSPEEAMTPTEQREHPILTGVGEVAGGMTSPQNVAILAASGGLGSLPGAAGRILPRMVSAGFSAQMAWDAYRQVPEFKAAIDRGDTSEAMRIGTHIAASGIMGYFAGRHALTGTPAVGASGTARPVEEEQTSSAVLQTAAARIRPIAALPPAESIGGEPIRTRLAAGAQPLITPEPTRTAAGAIITRGSPLSNRPALPEATGPEPDEVSDFLAGRSAAVPPLPGLRTRGVVEMAAPGAIRPQRTITVQPTEVTTEPPAQGALSLTGTAEEARGDLLPTSATEAAPANIRRLDLPPAQRTLSLTGTAEEARGNLRAAPATETAAAQIRAIGRGATAPESAAPRLNAFGEPMPEGTAAAARTEPAPKPEWPSAEMTRAANLTFGQLRRDPVEQQYARDVWSAMLDRERSPEPPYGMPLARARSIQTKLRGIATGEGLPSALNPDPRTSGEFKPDELDAAHQRLEEANSMLQQATPPGRYEKVEESGECGIGEWYGVNSLRTMFPWFADMKETPAELARAIERKQGPAYHRLLQSAAEYEVSSRQATRNIVQSVAPDLDQLVEQVRGIDPELAQILADAGAGKLGVFDGSLSRAREWAERNIDDARQLANLSGAIDELADAHHAEPAGAASAEESSRATGGSREEPGVLPGLSQAVREQHEATGRETARQLTEQSNRPPESFESAAGEMERTSPLFRGTEASPQREIFGAKPEAPTPNFSSSARAQVASREAPKSPEWLEGERQHEIARLNGILRNPRATPEETATARQQLAHYETAAGPARTPPSETGSTTLYSGIDPTRVTAAARLLSRAWQDRVAQPFIDRVLRIGDKYQKARAADPAVAEGLHLLDNAPQYLRQKAAQNIHDIIGGLSREQERLFTLMADADSRENLRANHREEYRQAQSDPAIQDAMRKYRQIERELTATRGKLGGDVLDQDYLRRVYDKYVAGIGKEQAPGSPERATSAFDRVIRPQRIGTMSREASAEYHYRNGLHEFGPAFATKFIGTNLRSLRDTVAKDFLSKAATLPAGAHYPTPTALSTTFTSLCFQ